MQHIIQTYITLMWVSGAELEMPKCLWYSLNFKHGPNGKCNLQRKFALNYKVLGLDEESQHNIEIPQIDTRVEKKILGNFMAPAFTSIIQRKTLIDKGWNFSKLINTGHLSSEDKMVTYRIILWPGLTYPLAVSSLSIQDLKRFSQTYGITLRYSLHLNKSFPDALLYGALKTDGLQLHR